jgi:hypothetical protein
MDWMLEMRWVGKQLGLQPNEEEKVSIYLVDSPSIGGCMQNVRN